MESQEAKKQELSVEDTKRVQIFTMLQTLQAIGRAWFGATYALFIVNQGFTLFQLNMVNTVFMTVNFLLDPITGALGDRFGHTRIWLMGILVDAIAMFLYSQSDTLTEFIIAEGLGAVGFAMMSQALESWLRNRLGEDATHKAKSLASAKRRLAAILPTILGAVIGARFGLHWPWLLASITALVTFVVGYKALKLYHNESRNGHMNPNGDEEEDSTYKKLTKSYDEIKKSRVLTFNLVLVIVTVGCFQPFNMFWTVVFQPYVPTELMGVLSMSYLVALAAGGYVVHGMKGIQLSHIGVCVLSIAIPMIFAGYGTNALVVIGAFILHEIGRGSLDELTYTYSNRYISKKQRSTTNSFMSAAKTFGAAGGLLLSGWLTTIFTAQQVWLISSIILLVFAIHVITRKQE